MKKFFVPVDFSDAAENALKYAVELSKKFDATIELFHAILPRETMDNNIYTVFVMSDYESVVKSNLDDWAKTVIDFNDFGKEKITTKVAIGSINSCLLTEIENSKADLVIMGTTGASRLKALFMGSTTAGLIGKTKVPLLAVPKDFKYQKLNKISYALESPLKCNSQSMKLLDTINDVFEPKSYVVKIQKAVKTGDDLEKETYLPYDHDFYVIENDDVTNSLQLFAQSHKSNLLVMLGQHHQWFQKLFFQRFTKDMAYHTKIPLLVISDM